MEIAVSPKTPSEKISKSRLKIHQKNQSRQSVQADKQTNNRPHDDKDIYVYVPEETPSL